jgi:hypothetical protein
MQYHVYSKDEQEVAMEREREFFQKKAKEAREGLISGTMDAIGGAVGGAGKLVAGGVGAVGSSVGRVGSSITKAARGVSSSFIIRSSSHSLQQQISAPDQTVNPRSSYTSNPRLHRQSLNISNPP